MGLNEQLVIALRESCPQVEVRENEPMAKHTSFRIGGPAAAMAFPHTQEELALLLRFCTYRALTPIILGAGSNVLAGDAGLDALVICTGGLGEMRDLGDDKIEVSCGVSMARAACFARDHGLSGLEFAHGIPGTVGGGLYMNAGAYGGEICQVAVETTCMTPDGEIIVYRGDEQGFSYRTSAFQTLDGVILKAVFQLRKDDPEVIGTRMRALMEKRRSSQPLDLPSAGSTFKRPAGGYAAALIEQAGLKGFRAGGAEVSAKHAGFVVNVGGASCADVLDLIAQVQKSVFDHSGIRLEPEVKIL